MKINQAAITNWNKQSPEISRYLHGGKPPFPTPAADRRLQEIPELSQEIRRLFVIEVWNII